MTVTTGKTMRIQRITDNSDLRGETCRHCNRKALPGQVVLSQDLMGDDPIVQRRFLVHNRCMKTLVNKAPEDQDEIRYHELRQRISETKEAFPDE